MSRSVILLLILSHMTLYIAVQGNAIKQELVLISGCVCPGSNATYECRVLGGDGFTVWQGSVLSCTGNEITLVHRRYTTEEGAFGECNDGLIVGKSVRVENGFYISQLNVTVSDNVIGKDIRCVHDASSTPVLIGNLTINSQPVLFPPPNEIHMDFSDNLGSTQLTARWSPVTQKCSHIRYSVLASNCGSCPTTTTNTTVTCTNVPTDGSICRFGVQTTVCGSIVGNISTLVSVSLNLSSHSTSNRNKGINGTGITAKINVVVPTTVTAFVVTIFVCLVIFSMVTTYLIKSKSRLQAELATHRSSARVTQNYDEVVHSSKANPKTVTVDTRKNIAYAIHTPNVKDV